MESLFLCDNCENDFNTDSQIPKIIPKCGHTVCLSCLTFKGKRSQEELDLNVDTPYLQSNFQIVIIFHSKSYFIQLNRNLSFH